MLNDLYLIHEQVVVDIPKKVKRYLYRNIAWDERSICIVGARGVGKTTLLLQHYLENYKNPEECLYISADNVKVAAKGLFSIAEEHFTHGGIALIIDEAHKYPGWRQEIKNIIDTFKKGKLIISGSSSLKLKQSTFDLSRRIVYYELHGLSFREFLMLEELHTAEPFSIHDLLERHGEIARDISSATPILRHFSLYLSSGYYPFFRESRKTYLHRVQNIIDKTLIDDIATTFQIGRPRIIALKKLLWIIATSHPFVPNIDRLSRELSLSKDYVYHYLEYLEAAGLTLSLHFPARGLRLARKPGKVFLQNTNLIHAITMAIRSTSETGTVRESFFANQVSVCAAVALHKRADFIVEDTFVFEIGGRSKTADQIAQEEHGYLAVDDIPIGHGNRIPLYLFGFLY